jgi:DNA replication protein DnaC
MRRARELSPAGQNLCDQPRNRYPGFPSIKTITDFDFTAQPGLDRAQIARPEGGGWLTEARNIVLLGPPGTDKTHLAPALAIAATHGGHRAPFAPATGWINRLAQARRINRLEIELSKISRYGLIVIDEVGYIPFDTEAANLFLQLVSSRYEKSSIISTSNLPFPLWGQVFGEASAPRIGNVWWISRNPVRPILPALCDSQVRARRPRS